ncbi:hypothetical protein ACEV8X_22550, partial [Vibrio parahaemolyticus]
FDVAFYGPIDSFLAFVGSKVPAKEFNKLYATTFGYLDVTRSPLGRGGDPGSGGSHPQSWKRCSHDSG